MHKMAGKRKAEQTAGAPAERAGASFDPVLYRDAVENTKLRTADVMESMRDFHRVVESEVRYSLGMHAQDVLGARAMRKSWSTAMSVAKEAADAAASVASLELPHPTTPYEVWKRSLDKLKDSATHALGLLNVERQLRGEELDRHRKNWELRLSRELEEERRALNAETSGLVKELRSELATSKEKAEHLQGQHTEVMDAEGLLQLRGVLEASLKRVEAAEARRACQERVVEIMPSAVCPVTLRFMVDPVVAADGHSYERSAIERWIQDAGEAATSPLTGEELAYHNLVTNWTLRKAIGDAVDAELAQRARAAASSNSRPR